MQSLTKEYDCQGEKKAAPRRLTSLSSADPIAVEGKCHILDRPPTFGPVRLATCCPVCELEDDVFSYMRTLRAVRSLDFLGMGIAQNQ